MSHDDVRLAEDQPDVAKDVVKKRTAVVSETENG